MKKAIPLILALVLAATAQAGESQLVGSAAKEVNAQASADQFHGTVVSTRPTNIEAVAKTGGNQVMGAAAGAVIGGIAGRLLGGKKHKTLGTVAGAGAGAMAGMKLTEGKTVKTGQVVPAIAIKVRRDNGSMAEVTQPLEGDVNFAPGDKVTVSKTPNGWHAAKDAAPVKTAEVKQ